ncbi:hypothetical protein B0H10DRAFT_1951851 [Mycena sp. CBHHK59/15]|nr:hypothetical protein B0H10DRAFT_1951851 [Mycena sp. CBHHK59/15]
MSVLVDGVRTSRVVISPFCLKPLSPLLLSRPVLGLPPWAFLGTIAVDCGPIESLSIRLPCALSFDQQTAVSLGVDWITSVRKWYLDHGCELPGMPLVCEISYIPNLLVPGASTAASATPVLMGRHRIPQLPQTRWVLSRSAHIRWLLPHIRWAVSYVRWEIPSIRARWK